MTTHRSKYPVFNDISDLRKTIDDIDEKILDLVNHRLSIAMRIGRLKQQKGNPIIDNVREKDILERLKSKNSGPLSSPDVKRVFSTIISASRAIQTGRGETKDTSSIGISLKSPLDDPGRMNTQTALFGLFGDPISHSLSPVMHNRAMQVTGFNGVYLAFEVKNLDDAVKSLRTLKMRGVSVTIPHKTTVMQYLDDVDKLGERVGAVNTICNNQGRLVGYNTDCEAALIALSEKTEVKGKKVAIIGAGGAAQAIGFGIVQAGARSIIYNRSKVKGETLAAHLEADFRPLAEFGKKGYDILINTTPVGMWPDIERMPVPETAIRKGAIIMDIIYNPVRTKLLQAAKRQGAIPIDGVTMFVLQGARQFKLWTGKEAPIDAMRRAVLGALKVDRI